MRFAKLRSRRGVNNVVATMLIFGIIIASIGVLYNQITPTLLGYEARATSANQEYIFETISQEVMNLASSNTGSASRIHIISEQTIYDIDNSISLSFDILNNGVSQRSSTTPLVIGAFEAMVNGSYQPSGERILNRVPDSSSYMNNGSNSASYVLSSDFGYNEGLFSMYFRPYIDVHQVSPTDWKMTITIIEIDYIRSNDDSPLAFPVNIPEWTLRLLKRDTVRIESIPSFVVNGEITITQALNGDAGSDLTFSGLDGQNLSVEIMSVPILFGI